MWASSACVRRDGRVTGSLAGHTPGCSGFGLGQACPLRGHSLPSREPSRCDPRQLAPSARLRGAETVAPLFRSGSNEIRPGAPFLAILSHRLGTFTDEAVFTKASWEAPG